MNIEKQDGQNKQVFKKANLKMLFRKKKLTSSI